MMSLRAWQTLFHHRSAQEELMEHPDLNKDGLIRALKEIRWVNRHLGGTTAIRTTLTDMIMQEIKPDATFSILDLGTGSADIPLALSQWGRANGVALRITAVDLHPTIVETAQMLTRGFPEIEVRQGNALNLPLPNGAFDFVISSMFLHHLTSAEAVILLKEMARLCGTGLLINDLERHPMAWLGIRLLGQLTAKGAVFRNDAPLSVLRGFQARELRQLCASANLHQADIQRRHPYRWLIRWKKPTDNRQKLDDDQGDNKAG